MNTKVGKLLAFEPSRDKAGNHKTFEASYGTLWKFLVKFDNGDKGEASSAKESPLWKINEEFSYELHVNGVYSNIRSMTPMKKDYAVNKQRTLEEWQFYSAKYFLKVFSSCTGANMMTIDIFEVHTDTCVQILTEVTEGSLDSKIWYLSINSLETLVRSKGFVVIVEQVKDICIERVKMLNELCLKHLKSE